MKDAEWIPTSERLPELHDANYPYRKGTKRSKPVYITYRQDGENYFYPLPVRLYDNGYWYTDQDSLEGINLDSYDDGTDTPFVVAIVAWMPMPEPFKNCPVKQEPLKDNPCYHCYAGAIGECAMTKCKHQHETWSRDVESPFLQ